jgi:hypothetical protein
MSIDAILVSAIDGVAQKQRLAVSTIDRHDDLKGVRETIARR